MALQDPVEALPGIRGIPVDFEAAPRARCGDYRLIRHHRSYRLSRTPCAR
jgi:hypothetical protein